MLLIYQDESMQKHLTANISPYTTACGSELCSRGKTFENDRPWPFPVNACLFGRCPSHCTLVIHPLIISWKYFDLHQRRCFGRNECRKNGVTGLSGSSVGRGNEEKELARLVIFGKWVSALQVFRVFLLERINLPFMFDFCSRVGKDGR